MTGGPGALEICQNRGAGRGLSLALVCDLNLISRNAHLEHHLLFVPDTADPVAVGLQKF